MITSTLPVTPPTIAPEATAVHASAAPPKTQPVAAPSATAHISAAAQAAAPAPAQTANISAASISAAAASQLMTNVGFSTRVGGKTYNADVTYSDGEYIARDPNVPGAVAAGSNLQTAENSLITRIDVLT